MKKAITVIGCCIPVAAIAMADRSAPVYGRPTLYGEYEISASDARRAAAMYGVLPKNVAEKMPVKPKKVIAKKSVKKKKARSASPVKKAKVMPDMLKPAEDVIVVPPRVVDVVPNEPDSSKITVAQAAEAVSEKKAPAPSAEALAIAGAATVPVAPSIESFCTRRGVVRKGSLPDGIVLMPGRPDLMSCSDK